MYAVTHQPYSVMSVEGEVLGRVTDLHYRNPARAEKHRVLREKATGIAHAVFFQKRPDGQKVRITPRSNTHVAD